MPEKEDRPPDDYIERVRRRSADPGSSIVGLHREVTRLDQQVRGIYDWLKNKDESDQRRFLQFTDALSQLSDKISSRDLSSSAPLWRFAMVLLGLGGVGASVLMGVGSMLYTFTNNHIDSTEHQLTYRIAQAEANGEKLFPLIMEAKAERTRLDEMAKNSKESLSRMDEVLQREMNLKDSTIREEINSRLAGIDKQYELVTIRLNELSTRVFELVGSTFPPIKPQPTSQP